MKEIFGILKKYIWGILVVIMLLFIQAQCDLKLPEYTSSIINIGIQQKGIESPIPDALSKGSYAALNAIIGDEKLNEYYKLESSGSKEYKEMFPLVDKEDIYVLKNLDEEKLDELKSVILKPEVFYLMITSQGLLKDKNFDIDKTVMDYYLKNSEVNEIKTLYNSIDAIDESMLEQYGVGFVLSEYAKLEFDIEGNQMKFLTNTGVKMGILALFIMVVIISSVYLSGRIAARIAYDLRDSVVEKVMSFSNSEFNEFSTASLITRTTNDISQIQNFFTMLLRMVMYAPIIGIGALVKVVSIDMSWVIAASCGAILVLIIILMCFVMPKFKIIQKLIDKINLVVRETLNGLPVIRAFANEDFEKKKFNKVNSELKKVNLFTQRTMGLMEPFMTLIMNGTIVIIMWVGASRIDLGAMQVGTLTALISYTMQIIMSFLMLSMLSIIAPRAIIAIKRVREILDKDTSIKNKKNACKIGKSDGYELEFDHVDFKYPDGDELVLNDISFKVKEGETLAIIGSTGSGKSSIVNLIPRFFDISDGSIKINGKDIRDYDLESLRDIIGVVPQKGLLFSGTIESNIKFSNLDMSDRDMEEAADVACAKEFIEKKEGRYQSEISQGGTNVSGGQRQRLSIARAVAKKPNIFIFDDSFSALDYKTDSMIRKNLTTHCSKATKIIVAQRVGTILNADQIVVLDKGKIVGIGTHKELYKSCKLYKDIALSQLKEEELV